MSKEAAGGLGLALAMVLGLVTWQSGLGLAAAAVAATAGLCAVWWTLEPISMGATSALPFVILPLAGAASFEDLRASLFHPLILLLFGGFVLSRMLERSEAHRRIAVAVVRGLSDGTGRRTVLGFMVACAGLSMWISNTATTLMLLPAAMAVVAGSSDPKRLGPPLFLGLAWSASIGGIATPVGTPPNPLLLAELHALGNPWGFPSFMRVGVPIVALLLPMAWLWLCRGGRLDGVEVGAPPVESWKSPEKRALVLFAITVVLWVTRKAPFGGWSGALELPWVGDHTVALFMAALAFFVPNGQGERLLNLPTARRVPWGLLLLFAGGIALGKAFGTTGLDDVLAAGLSKLGALPLLGTMAVISVCVSFATEITSNTATAALLLPVLSQSAHDAGDDPVLWLVPAAFSASCAFMLPVATAPNAIVVGSGQVRTMDMVREGFVMNLLGAAVISVVAWLTLA